MQKRNILLVTSLLILLLFTIPAAAETIIVHTNDIHGYLADSIGYDGLSAYIQDLKAAGDDAILLDAGDAFQGTAAVNYFKGESALNLMNMLGYQAMCAGNHDFDFGQEHLLNLANETKFPILAANIFYEASGEPVFSDSIILNSKDMKIGVFGLDTPETKTQSKPENTDWLVFAEGDELCEIAQNEVNLLKEAGCDIIICLGHLGLDEFAKPDRSCDIAEKVKGIDLLIDGHSHTVLESGMQVGNTLIVSTGCHLENIGVVRMKDGKPQASLVPASEYTKKEGKVSAVIKEYTDEVDKKYGEIIGETKVNLNGEKSPGCRTEETNFGDLICDAVRWKAEKLGCSPDISLINGGSIRISVPAGDISRKNLFDVMPFSNTLTVAKIPGSVLLSALEANSATTPEPEGGFAQVSGMSYFVDTAKEYKEGEINRVSIGHINGAPFDADKLYMVATTDFIAAGGDKYAVFAGLQFYDLGVLLDDTVCEYIQDELKGVVDTSYEKPAGRISVGAGEHAPSATAASPLPVCGILAAFSAALLCIKRK